jgi:hypothetical protein
LIDISDRPVEFTLATKSQLTGGWMITEVGCDVLFISAK